MSGVFSIAANWGHTPVYLESCGEFSMVTQDSSVCFSCLSQRRDDGIYRPDIWGLCNDV